MSDSDVMVIRPEDTAAKSDQLNADDLMGRTLVGRVVGFKNAHDKDQPWWLKLDCWPQPWKPCKGQRRILQDAWGTDPHAWIGRVVELHRDPDVKWGGEAVGGIRISGLSHIGRDREYRVTVSRGNKPKQHVRCLPHDPPRRAALTLDQVIERLRERGWLDEAVDAHGDNFDAWDVEAVTAWAKSRATRDTNTSQEAT